MKAELGLSSEKRQFNRTLSAMVLPIAFQNLMTALVSASDAVMLGFLEQEALSAVSLAGQVTFVFNLCVTVLVQGTTMLAAQYWGKGERDTVLWQHFIFICQSWQYILSSALMNVSKCR